MRIDVRQIWSRHPGGINLGLLTYAIAAVTAALGMSMLLAAVAGALRDGRGIQGFVIVGAGVVVPAALILVLARPPRITPVIRARDVFLTVTACWTVAALLSALPIWIEGGARSYVAAVFEAMSGYTTTGSTIFDAIEPLPDSVLLWRSLTQWLGGIGIVVLLVGIAPALGMGSSRALFAEVSGPLKERYTPRIAETARALVRIYVVLSLACTVSYVAVGMTIWNAILHAMATVSTGGFSPHTASLGHYDPGPQLVAILFMFLGGVNFGLYILLSMRQRSSMGMRYEFWWYCAALVALTIVVTATLVGFDHQPSGRAVLDAAFAIVSIVTTTGFVTADFDTWNQTARTVLLPVMFVGGCAGSTVGGIKIIRWMMLGVSIRTELRRLMHPSAVVSVRLGDRHFADRDILTLMSFVMAYMFVFVASAIGVAATSSVDVVSALSASAASIALVGPGLGSVGASESYSVLSDTSLAILSATMLLGRLEIFTVLALLTPAFWRRR